MALEILRKHIILGKSEVLKIVQEINPKIKLVTELNDIGLGSEQDHIQVSLIQKANQFGFDEFIYEIPIFKFVTVMKALGSLPAEWTHKNLIIAEIHDALNVKFVFELKKQL